MTDSSSDKSILSPPRPTTPSIVSQSTATATNGSSPSLEAYKTQYKYQALRNPLRKTSAAPSAALQPSNFHLFVKAGLPFLLFSVGASFVLKSAVEGKNLERDRSKGLISK